MSQKAQSLNWQKLCETPKNSELGLPTRCFFFLLILFTKVGTKLTKKVIKKPIIRLLWRALNYRLCKFADADQHRDRITRFGLLKHRAKLQEQYLWTQVDFNSDSPSDESIEAQGCNQIERMRSISAIPKLLHCRSN